MSTTVSQLAPMSRSRAEKLGKLWARAEARPVEVAEIRAHLQAHITPMDNVRQKIARIGLTSTARLKTETTLKQKLDRSTALGNMQDIAGVRVVRPMTLDEQDAVVQGIRRLWPDAKVEDRRLNPSCGYRAVHLVVKEQGFKVEVQVRTQLQHDWAQAMERLADGWGRQIRYGGEPNDPDTKVGKRTRRGVVEDMIQMGFNMEAYEQAENQAIREGRDVEGELREMAKNFFEVLDSAHSGLRQIHMDLSTLVVASPGNGVSGQTSGITT